jgi:hypothetical protein
MPIVLGDSLELAAHEFGDHGVIGMSWGCGQ